MRLRALTPGQWNEISFIGKWVIYLYALRVIHRTYHPLPNSLFTCGCIFSLLGFMPLHPLSPLIAFGGGLSIGLILWRGR